MEDLKNQLGGCKIYEASLDEADGTTAAIVRTEKGKRLALMGRHAGDFFGEKNGGVVLCPFTEDNASALQALFPYTRPCSHAEHDFTIGLGDRLGLATPGHVEAVEGTGAFPVFAQQSIRELTLTGRSFQQVIADAAFGVFQKGYKSGYGADGDHLKTKEEIAYALECGCTMITLDCSAHIDIKAEAMSQAEVDSAYAQLPDGIRAHYEELYLDKILPIVGTMSGEELHRIVLVFYKAIDHACGCYRYISSIRNNVDFELSIDETRTVTTPAEHFVVANELALNKVRPVSVAPHFSGEFEKGIEYIGRVADFARDFEVHQQIADHFGYKLSVHSGSDKFSVFSTVGRITGGRVHIKTAGTNWLEAMAVVAEHDPSLYRRAHKYALENRGEAEKYYHVSTDPDTIPGIDLQSDLYLPEYLRLPASRQTIHIAYGLLLSQNWFRDEFFRFMYEHEEEYYARLKAHIRKHIDLILSGSRD